MKDDDRCRGQIRLSWPELSRERTRVLRGNKAVVPRGYGHRASSWACAALLLGGVAAVVLAPTPAALAEGRFLRGERWRPFSRHGTHADFYVSPDGNDSFSGTLPAPNAQANDGPFATIHRAQQAVRQLKRQVFQEKKKPIERRWHGSPHKFGQGRDILVLVRGGYYSLETPLRFGHEDGGERCETDLPSGAFEYHKLKDYFVTYAAYPGEAPILSGGRRIAHWTKDNGLWTATVRGIDVKRFLVGGHVQPLARTPNDGYYSPPEMAASNRSFRFRPGQLRRWPQMQDNRIVMLLRWHTGVNSIDRIDEQQRIAYLQEPQNGMLVVPPRYYVENVKALLDAPGEWFFDRQRSELSYLPAPDRADPASANAVVPVLTQLVSIHGRPGSPVRNLRLYALQFEATNPGRHAISFQYAHGCELVGASVRGVGAVAIHVAKGCYNNRILSNRISGAEQGAIAVDGDPHPERWLDIIRQTIISRNSVFGCGGRSIAARNCLNTVISHNEIADNHGRTGIHVGGWANVEEAIDGGYRVQYNHLHHVQKQADDSGAITTAGLTHDSRVRGNLIHDVSAGYFNDNVAIWFDNMSSGWQAEDNIYYNLGQGEMKLCAANLVDNIYRDNYLVESPENPPESIINGRPDFQYGSVRTMDVQDRARDEFQTGQCLIASTMIRNTGSTGIRKVDLYVDGRRREAKKFPVIHNNRRQIRFPVLFSEPGEHRIAIGESAYKIVRIRGARRSLLYDTLDTSDTVVPAGERIEVSARVTNVESHGNHATVVLYVDGKTAETKSLQLSSKESRRVVFLYAPREGDHLVRIGHTPARMVRAYPHRELQIAESSLRQYCSGTAAPFQCEIDRANCQFRLSVAGTDFFHGEDSYGAVFVRRVKGNFVATTRIKRFGKDTHEWFRAGLFARNDMTKSFDVEPGSRGSVLLFATPARVGMNWDEHGDGCMHKGSSRNHRRMDAYPIGMKLVRHENSFSGYVSYDGDTWTPSGRTPPIPGLAAAVDIGLAAGGPDQRIYEVEFEGFTLDVEQAN